LVFRSIIIIGRLTDRNYNKSDIQITAILGLIGSALHDGKEPTEEELNLIGKLEFNHEKRQENKDRFLIIKNGILAIIENDMGQYLLSGYDISKPKKYLDKANEMIKLVISKYGNNLSKEFSNLQKEVAKITFNYDSE